jgi:hypothetical protein
MRKAKIAIVAAVLASVPLIGAAPHTEAMTCAPDLQDACAVVARVVCAVVAKGRPCLY